MVVWAVGGVEGGFALGWYPPFSMISGLSPPDEPRGVLSLILSPSSKDSKQLIVTRPEQNAWLSDDLMSENPKGVDRPQLLEIQMARVRPGACEGPGPVHTPDRTAVVEFYLDPTTNIRLPVE